MTASEPIIRMRGPLISNFGFWFAVLSPLIGLIFGLVGAWLVG